MYEDMKFFNIVELAAGLVTGNVDNYDANLEKIVAEIKSGNGEDVKPTQTRIDAAFKIRGCKTIKFAKKYSYEFSTGRRNAQAHGDKLIAEGTGYQRATVAELEKIFAAEFNVAADFDYSYVSTFAEINEVFFRAIWKYNTFLAEHYNTLGRLLVHVSASSCYKVNKRTIKTLWRFNNLRNKHAHTGYELTANERRFVKSVAANIEKYVAEFG